jgi:hypothetical protein
MGNRLCWLCAGLFALIFLCTDLSIAQRRLFWYDEIGTLELAKIPDFGTFWRVQNSPWGDSAPPLYVMLARLFYTATGRSEIAVRVMSALALMTALLVIFDCARRLSDGIHGLIALTVITSSFVTYYGFEGRAYTLVVLFTACALWVWLHTRAESKAAAAAFGALIFAAVSMHFNSVLAMVPFTLWEISRWKPWAKPSPKLLAGALGVLCAAGIAAQQVKVMSVVGPSSASSWSAPTLPGLVQVLSQMYPAGLFTLAVFAVLRCFMWGMAKPMADAEKLCWLFLTIPVAGFLLAEAVTRSFQSRYLITTVPGVAVGFACMAYRQLGRWASIAVLLLISLASLGRQYRDYRGAEDLEPPSAALQQLQTRQALALEDALLKDGKKHVIAQHTVVRALRYYSKHPEIYVAYGPDAAPYFCEYLGAACWGPEIIKAHASEIAGFYPTEKLLEMMTKAGFPTKFKRISPAVVYFLPR